MRTKVNLITGLIALFSAFSASAVTIQSYDIQNSPPSGFGGWSHTYNGTITFNGVAYDYSGGSGTLNDGVIGTSHDNTHLFYLPHNPSITVHLDAPYEIGNGITLFSFVGGNSIPGNMTHVDVTINGVTQTLATDTSAGTQHEFVDLSFSGFIGATTDTIIFSNLKSSGGWSDYASISEIVLNGKIALPTPEGGVTAALFGLGIAGLGLARRKLS